MEKYIKSKDQNDNLPKPLLQGVVNAKGLLSLLAEYGGKIISSNDLHPDLINQARASNRMYVDENSLGYVWEPNFKNGFPTTQIEGS